MTKPTLYYAKTTLRQATREMRKRNRASTKAFWDEVDANIETFTKDPNRLWDKSVDEEDDFY